MKSTFTSNLNLKQGKGDPMRKHIQSMLRINVDKHSVFDANNFQKYMVLNSLISNMVNGGNGNRFYPTKYKIGDYGAKLPSSMNQDVNPFIEYKRKVYIKGAKQYPKLYILEMLIKRYKIYLIIRYFIYFFLCNK